MLGNEPLSRDVQLCFGFMVLKVFAKVVSAADRLGVLLIPIVLRANNCLSLV